jgi:hypothetical protein
MQGSHDKERSTVEVREDTKKSRWDFWDFHWPNSFGRTVALGSTQPVTEMSTWDLTCGWRRPVRRADNLTTFILESLVASTSWTSMGLSRLVMGQLFRFYLYVRCPLSKRTSMSLDLKKRWISVDVFPKTRSWTTVWRVMTFDTLCVVMLWF